jgi:hypothetical protein
MDVFGHDDVAGDEEFVTKAHGFERTFKQISSGGSSEVGKAVITGEGYEVEVSSPLIPD